MCIVILIMLIVTLYMFILIDQRISIRANEFLIIQLIWEFQMLVDRLKDLMRMLVITLVIMLLVEVVILRFEEKVMWMLVVVVTKFENGMRVL